MQQRPPTVWEQYQLRFGRAIYSSSTSSSVRSCFCSQNEICTKLLVCPSSIVIRSTDGSRENTSANDQSFEKVEVFCARVP